MKRLTVEVLTPECCVFRGEADMVVAGTVDGERGVLAGHMPLISALVKGKLRLLDGPKTTYVAVDAGLFNVRRDTVTVMSIQARIWVDAAETRQIGE